VLKGALTRQRGQRIGDIGSAGFLIKSPRKSLFDPQEVLLPTSVVGNHQGNRIKIGNGVEYSVEKGVEYGRRSMLQTRPGRVGGIQVAGIGEHFQSWKIRGLIAGSGIC
jgi:hypothetical protein